MGVASGVWAYRRQQWLCLALEKLRVPFPLLLPKPVFIIVDQFEELLRSLEAQLYLSGHLIKVPMKHLGVKAKVCQLCQRLAAIA